MNNKELALSFRLVEIITNEFAKLENSYSGEGKVRMGTFINFRTDNENHIIGNTVKFQFEENEKPFLVISATCVFKIEESAWNSLLEEDKNKIVLPEGFASHLAVITVGTVRGIFHEKTKETRFKEFIIPPINLTKIIKEDISIDLIEID